MLLIERFGVNVEVYVLMDNGKRIVIFGAGAYGREALLFYGKERVLAFCDNEKGMHGTIIDDKEVISFEKLKSITNVYVSIAVRNITYVEQISSQLKESNINFGYFREDKAEKFDDIKTAFTRAYAEKRWGEEGRFNSGPGSHDEKIIEPYIKLLVDLISYNKILKISELGCGDFYIMNIVLSKLKNMNMNIEYSGVDIVEELIEYNKTKYIDSNVRFYCDDGSREEFVIPSGDLLIIRQVLQHLDNRTILKIIEKSKSFRYVLISEHIYDRPNAIFNLDKDINDDIRLFKASGVYLEEAPYNCNNIVHLLKVPQFEGAIRTSLIIN